MSTFFAEAKTMNGLKQLPAYYSTCSLSAVTAQTQKQLIGPLTLLSKHESGVFVNINECAIIMNYSAAFIHRDSY